MNIESNYKKIFVKEGNYGTMYSTSVAYKLKDGNWKTSYINLYFPDDNDVSDGDLVKFKGYLSPTNDPYKVAIKITEYEKKEESKSIDSFTTEDIVQDDDLPF